MITHGAFFQHLNRIFTKAMLAREARQHVDAGMILDYAIQEIECHSRNTNSTPPQLLKLQRDIYKNAYELLAREYAG